MRTSIACAIALIACACDPPPVERIAVPGSDPQIACSPVDGPRASRDAQAAIATARSAWASIYEKNPSSSDYSPASIARFEPYLAILRGATWQVRGTVPNGHHGPVPIASVCRNDDAVSTKWVTGPTVTEQVAHFIPKDASNPITATEVAWLQQSFDVSRQPFEFAVSSEELERARSDGWRLCREPDARWEGFDDATVSPRRYVRQKVYVLYRGGVLLTLIGRYYGTSEAEPPGLQHVMLIAREASEAELEEAAENFRLSCDQSAPVR